jgi:putative transposase
MGAPLAWGGRSKMHYGAGASRPSMGSAEDAYDNAMCKSFFATLEGELFGTARVSSVMLGFCDSTP